LEIVVNRFILALDRILCSRQKTWKGFIPYLIYVGFDTSKGISRIQALEG
jgi:hypothetical protein